jgi:fructokinase
MTLRIGVDLGGTKIEALVLDRNGDEVSRKRIPTPRGDYEATVRAIRGLVGAVAAEAGERASDVPVGVGIPGTLSPTTGLVKNANSTWLIGRAFDRDLEAALGRPVRLANDANCFALSEAVDGAGQDGRVVFGVIVGTGTGAGLVVDRRVHVGRNAIAGEWGHNPLPWADACEIPGESCYCGKRGCIETFLSGPGLERDFAATSGMAAPAEAIAGLAAAGDPAARATIDRYARRMAKALASVINVIDPDVIVLGGGCSNVESLYDEVPRLWARYAFSDSVTTPLRRNRHGDSSGVRGAAWLWPDGSTA